MIMQFLSLHLLLCSVTCVALWNQPCFFGKNQFGSDLLNVILNLVCEYFVEFYICIYQGDWLVILPVIFV